MKEMKWSKAKNNHIDRLSTKIRTIVENNSELSKTVKQLETENNDLKVQANITEKLNEDVTNTLKWADNIEKEKSLKDQAHFFKNAFISSTVSSGRLKKMLLEYETLIEQNEKQHKEEVDSLKRKLISTQNKTKEAHVGADKERSSTGEDIRNSGIGKPRTYSNIENDSKNANEPSRSSKRKSMGSSHQLAGYVVNQKLLKSKPSKYVENPFLNSTAKKVLEEPLENMPDVKEEPKPKSSLVGRSKHTLLGHKFLKK